MPRHWRRFLFLVLVLVILIGLSLLPGLFVERAGEEQVPPDAGRVRTISGAPPPPEVRVEAWGDRLLGEASIARDGTFRFDSLPGQPGEYEVSFPGGRCRVPAREGPVEVLVPGPKDGVSAGEDTPTPETISIGGVLVDAGRERPVPGAEVRLGKISSASDERGRFSLGEVPAPGAADPPLTIRSAGYRTVYILPPGVATWDDLYVRLTSN